jgi:SAM-dependent methyltransferase
MTAAPHPPARRLPSVDEIRALVGPLDFFERYVNGQHEGDVYVQTHAARFRETLAWLPPDLGASPRVLELGAVPYAMTVLMKVHAGARVDPLSFYEVEYAHAAEHVVTNRVTGERFVFPFVPVNVERDLYPVAAAEYDLVLCCEILEHLLINPSHMLAEAHRALRPGGYLLISTPNVVRSENVAALVEGRNINDRYHGNGVYGRHNREFTRAEVEALVTACGFDLVRSETRDVYPPPACPPAPGAGREDTIFVLARASRPARVACPPELYVLMDEYRNPVRPAIALGVDDVGHLGPGWYDAEFEEDHWSRWTGGTAAFALRGGTVTAFEIEVCSHHQDLGSRPVHLTVEAGGATGRGVVAGWGWHHVTLPLDRPVTGPVVEARLSVDRTWVPREAGVGDDGRVLGVRVRRIAATQAGRGPDGP